MSYLDRKYVVLVGQQLERFTQKNQNLWNCRCPFCGDSKRSKIKARGYFYEKSGKFMYSCHNCNVSLGIYAFLKQVDASLAKDYIMDTFKDGKKEEPKSEKKKEPIVVKDRDVDLTPIGQLPINHFALQYVYKRKIPKSFWNDLFFAPDYALFVSRIVPECDKELPGDARLVIPFRDVSRRLVGFQGRALEPVEPRYVSIKLLEESPKIYGLDRFDRNKPGYVFEGPIDSMFISNSLGAAGSNLQEVSQYIDKDLHVFVFDNQPRNKDIVRLMSGAIKNGFKVCFWPEDMIVKDVNDMILEGWNPSEIQYLIDSRTKSGIEAELELTKWRK